MTILIQGAMDCELDVLRGELKACPPKVVKGYEFSVCDYRGNRIVLSKTDVGIINACISTSVGIQEFHPALVINQGCAGAHIPEMTRGDLVIGEKAVYINDFRTDYRAPGQGSDSLNWKPGSRNHATESTPRYVELARATPFDGKTYVGTIGSGDLISREADRIQFFRRLYGEICEDMETAASLKTCNSYGIDRLALRIISNNELTREDFDYGVCADLQRYILGLLQKICG